MKSKVSPRSDIAVEMKLQAPYVPCYGCAYCRKRQEELARIALIEGAGGVRKDSVDVLSRDVSCSFHEQLKLAASEPPAV